MIPKDKRIRISLTLFITMNDVRADLDGPHKRIQDAIATGLNFNDNRIDNYQSTRMPVGEPGIHAIVETIGDAPGEDLPELEDPWSITVGDTYADIRSIA